MKEIKVKSKSRIVDPIFKIYQVYFIYLTIISIFHKDWMIVVLSIIVIFITGIFGASLPHNKNKTSKELSKGNDNKYDEITEDDKHPGLPLNVSNVLGRFTLFSIIVFLIIFIHAGKQWYLALLFAMIITVLFIILGYQLGRILSRIKK